MSGHSTTCHSEFPLAVDFDHFPARCNRRGHPDTWLPDDPEELEITSVRLFGLELIELLSPERLADIESQCHEWLESQATIPESIDILQ